MSSRTVVQHSEELTRAIKWLGAQLDADSSRSVGLLVSDAGPRFNLSPADQETLLHIGKKYKKEKRASAGEVAPGSN